MKRCILVITLSALLLAGIVGGAVLAQKLTAEKREDALPFEAEKLASSFSLCDGLSADAVLRTSLAEKLQQPELSVTLCGLKESEGKFTLSTQNLTGRQATALSYLLMTSDFASQELNGFAAPPSSLSEAELCRLRDNCFLLIDRLDEAINSDKVLDTQTVLHTSAGTLDYGELNNRFFTYREMLDDWAKEYCPADWSRTFKEEHYVVSGFLEMEYNHAETKALKAARKQQMEQADQLLADVKAGKLDPKTALDRLNALWDHRDDGI